MFSSISSISSMGSYMGQMSTQSMQHRRDDLFNKIDSNSDGGLDKIEFSDLAKKLSKNTGSSLSVEDVFSTYDTNGDGALSKDELDSFMKENAPRPPMGMGGQMGQMNAEAMQQRQDRMFSKMDSNGDGGLDKTEFKAVAEKISKMSGNSINVEDAFSTYDADGDGSLSADETKSFMKDNAPRPPAEMQYAISAYGISSGGNQISSLMDLLNNQSNNDTSGSTTASNSMSTYLSKLLESFSSGTISGDFSSLIDVTA